MPTPASQYLSSPVQGLGQMTNWQALASHFATYLVDGRCIADGVGRQPKIMTCYYFTTFNLSWHCFPQHLHLLAAAHLLTNRIYFPHTRVFLHLLVTLFSCSDAATCRRVAADGAAKVADMGATTCLLALVADL